MTQTQGFQETNAFQNKFARTVSNKNRSLSFGNGKRRFSKTSCFAEAKKVEIPKSNFSQTQQFFRSSN